MSHVLGRRTRAGFLAIAVAAAIATVVSPGTHAAHAAVPDHWGFAFNDKPNPPASYVMPTSRQWGSWKAAFPADWAKVSQVGTGSYVVRFPHLAGKGVVHVTAVHQKAVWCQVGAWKPSGTDELISVRCFTVGGAPTDSAFTVVYSESSGVTSTGGYGWVWGNATGSVAASYNSTGAANASGLGGTGLYKVFFPGLGSSTAAGNFQVTAVNPKAARCKVQQWFPGAGGQTVLVQCYDGMGSALNTAFTVTYHLKRTVFGAALPPKLYGYVEDTLGAIPAALNYNSVSAVNTVVSAGTGLRMVTFKKIGLDPSHVQVTAFGKSSAFCNLLTPWAIISSDAVVRDVACYTATGARINERSFVTYSSRF
jgi:hypothetical protein